MVSRRSFIRQSLLATGGLILSSSALGRVMPRKNPKVIIIGAGFAGLSAAYYLRQRNIDVTVLESRGRIGGRVFSYEIDPELVIELGAEWVGNSHTRIQELCGEFKLPLINNQMETHLLYKGDYSPAGKWDYSPDWKNRFKKILEAYPELPDPEKEILDKMDWWRYLVNNGCNGRDLDIRDLLDSTDFGESIRHVSAFAALSEYAESSPHNEMDLKISGGNARLAHALANKIGEKRILKKHRVTRVEQGAKVTVHCDNGKIFTADKLICTAPTFALKQIDWQPGLPEAQVAAINELQYARINKHALLFGERFWEESFDLISDQLPHYFYHATKGQASDKGVLIAYATGDKAAVIANQSDSYMARQIAETLSPVWQPGKVLRSLEQQKNYYWGNDEYSHGAYALYGKGQWFRVRRILAEPFLNTHFAGEHLADWQGFMEGAIETGEAAAEAVLYP